MKPQYFDLTGVGVHAARAFFEACVGLMRIPVPDIYEVIRRVEQSSGRVVEAKRAVAGIGWFCTCAEPGGLLLGVLQQDVRAQ